MGMTTRPTPASVGNAIAAIIKREGGYCNNPADAGGQTCWGITIAVARAYGYTGPMSELPREVATAIYLGRYWLTPRLDQINDVFPDCAEKLFDIGVNMGQATGIRFLQRALNTLNNGHWQDIAADGNVGPLTIYALQQFLQQRGIDGCAVLITMIRAQQSVRYMEIAEGKTSQEEFEYGWQRQRAML